MRAIATRNQQYYQEVEITINEFREALQELKKVKVTGLGDIPIELIKNKTDLLEIVVEIFNKYISGKEQIPDDSNFAYTSSIYKTEDKEMCKTRDKCY